MTYNYSKPFASPHALVLAKDIINRVCEFELKARRDQLAHLLIQFLAVNTVSSPLRDKPEWPRQALAVEGNQSAQCNKVVPVNAVVENNQQVRELEV